jgi:hypothetical protein
VGELADRLDRLQVRTELPGTGITGTVRDRTELILSFAGNTYYRSTDDELAHRLTNLGRLLWVAWTRGYYEELSAVSGSIIRGERPAQSAKELEYVQRRAQIVAEGRAADGRIRVTVQGLQALAAHIQPGTLRALSEEEFIIEARKAVRAMLEDHQDKIIALKVQVYGDPIVNRPRT